jgi:hypothetical protein
MIHLEQITLTQTITKVESLIDAGKGDSGRLNYILEFLKNNRSLYHTDQIYLENMLNFSFSVKKEPKLENSFLPKVQQLINYGNGDLGRLQHIYHMLKNNKTLYSSDQIYLESKLYPLIKEPGINKAESPKPKQLKENILLTHKEIPKKTESKPKIQGTPPKGGSLENNLKELNKISNNIKDAQQKIEEQQKILDEINIRRANLTELASSRKEYEQKVRQERSSLESQIKDEKSRIEIETKLSEEIVAQKEELAKIKKEKADIVKNIDSEKTIISKELPLQKRQLAQAKLEQEKIRKQLQNEQDYISKMVKEQKSRLLEQAKIAPEIKSKQAEFKKTKQDYNEIVSQVNEEKIRFAESSKLKKLIKTQEQDLIKAKEERLHQIVAISKEKELISKKTQEEMKRLKSQTKSAKQLKKEEKNIKFLIKKRKNMEQQIKVKNHKLKEQQQKLKKQIAEKDKKLKSLAKKSLVKVKAKPPAKVKAKLKPKKTIKKSVTKKIIKVKKKLS